MSVPRMPMSINQEHDAQYRWLRKPVLANRLLDDTEDPSFWVHQDQGQMTFTTERCKVGTQSVRLISPTLSDKSWQGEEAGRPYGRAALKRLVNQEDWQSYNRLSFWVFPTLPGFRVISMSVILYNEGVKRIPDAYAREGIHYFLLKPDQWNHVIWEIAHLPRDRVTGLEFVYRLQGSDRGATRTVVYDLDLIELQQVEADPFEGWGLGYRALAFSHTGYEPLTRKVALASNVEEEHFRIVDCQTGAIAFAGPVDTLQTPLGCYHTLDFTALVKQGEYAIQTGSTQSKPFRIESGVWRDTIWKTINLFYCERCGTEVPGIHADCHRDWLGVHGDQRISISGGWHDAGDLSQGLVNTAEAVYAMLALAQSIGDTEEELAERLIEEACWGLDWVLKTRFGDGYRITWATMDLWTDGIMGTADDEESHAKFSSFDNAVAAATEALAAQVLLTRDGVLAAYCLRCAQEDLQFALAGCEEWSLALASQIALAALQIYKAGGGDSYADRAVEAARIITACQQQSDTDWDVPMRGFYYTTREQNRILQDAHRGHEQAPTVALTELCQLLPSHPERADWLAAIHLHVHYLSQCAEYTAPYHMLTAGIYHMDESDSDSYQSQVKQGVALGSGYYLRRFPVWNAFRGNSGTVLSQTKALSAAGKLLQDESLLALCREQLEWVVGRNPFSQSLMYGEGYDFAPQYTAMSGDMVGSLPVGVETREDLDTPYWPMQNCYNYKEVWVHPSSRWLWILADLSQ